MAPYFWSGIVDQVDLLDYGLCKDGFFFSGFEWEAGEVFQPFSCGLRQGDLFLIVSEALSLRITKAVNEKDLLGISLSRGSPILSHLFFADDALFFLKGTLLNCQQLGTIFNEYCTAFGQLINIDKSSIYFTSNTPRQMALLMCELLSFTEVMKPSIYLGIPSIWGRSKKGVLSYIKERVSRKVEGWKQCTLSMAGKETMIKSVALAIPAYPMSCFKFPLSTSKEINSLISNFLWGTGQNGNKFKWLPPPNAAKVRVIGDIPANGPSSVGSLIDWDLRGWNTTAIDHVIHPQDMQRIVDTPISDREDLDRFLWPWNKTDVYTVIGTILLCLFLELLASVPLTSSIPRYGRFYGASKLFLKVRVFLWRVLHEAALTMHSLHKRRIISNPLCPVCGKAEEIFEHLNLLCHWVDPIWFGSPLGIRIDKRKITTFDR
ncbi:hypothetical protein ACLB2K_065810 [Fragaria x ananassa]